MTDTPYLTRARETLRRLFPKGSPFAQTDLAEKLAAEFAQVRNEALEEAAALVDEAAGEPQSHLGNRIRSLKEPRQ